LIEERLESQVAYDAIDVIGATAQEADGEVQRPPHGFRRPRGDRVRQIKERRHGLDRARVARNRAGQTLEQCRLPGAVGPDDAEHLADADVERDVVQRAEASVALAEVTNVQGRGRRNGAGHEAHRRLYGSARTHYQNSSRPGACQPRSARG
jgi:hypothetical protein